MRLEAGGVGVTLATLQRAAATLGLEAPPIGLIGCSAGHDDRQPLLPTLGAEPVGPERRIRVLTVHLGAPLVRRQTVRS